MHIRNEKEMQDFAKDFLKKELHIVALHGELGAGKSTFVRAVASELGVEEFITSPTFNIMKSYKIDSKVYKFKNLVHIDAYRLKGSEELNAIDWPEIAADKNNLIFIEWPENIINALPRAAEHLYFSYINENTRAIEYRPSLG